MSPTLLPPPAPPRRVLPALVIAQLAGTSPWFAANAVMPDLQAQFGWDAAAVGSLSAALQLGFIGGTLLFALLAVADRWSARRVFLSCAIAAAACTLAAAASTRSAASFTALIGWRALTGFCLAGIYPVGMKIAAQWFPHGLGGALGWLVGALVLGSASPHALRALGAGWDWQAVFCCVALLTASAGLLVIWAIPEPGGPATAPATARATAPAPASAVPAAAGLRVGALASLWRDARVRASVLGYFGHMWELYTLWVLLPLVLATRLADARQVSWAAFAVLGAGAIGCVAGGRLARRWGSARVAQLQLAISAACCLLAPLMLGAPLQLFIAWLLVWGITVAGDSPQFSALTAANAPRAAVGSVLTLSNSIGFAISALSIALFVRLSQSMPLHALLPALALGPVLGLWAMRPLLRAGPAATP